MRFFALTVPGLGPLLWHTNHGRYLSGAEPEA